MTRVVKVTTPRGNLGVSSIYSRSPFDRHVFARTPAWPKNSAAGFWIFSIEQFNNPQQNNFTDNELLHTRPRYGEQEDTMLTACQERYALLQVAEHREAGRFHFNRTRISSDHSTGREKSLPEKRRM